MNSSGESLVSLTRTSSKYLVALVFVVIYAAIGLVRHAHFGSNAYDLGIFDQMVWHLGRFERPASTIHGLSNMLGDHFSPIHVLYVPLSWLWPSAQSLIVTQAMAFGLSIVPVWIFLERKLPKRAATLLALGYGCFWGLQRAAQFDVHELAFAPLLIALMVLMLDRMLNGDRVGAAERWLFVCAAVLCLVKEDQIPLVVALFALWALRTNSARDRIVALASAAAALGIFITIVKVVIPSLSDSGAWAVGSAFTAIKTDPLSFMTTGLSVKLRTLVMWLAPFVLLPLLSPYALLLVPLALERFLSSSPNHWGTSFHYTAPLAPILAMAAGDGLARLSALSARYSTVVQWPERFATSVAALCLLLCALLPGHEPMWKLLSPSFYAAPPFADAAVRALALIPNSASVMAQSPVVPHLSRRNEIYMMRTDGPSVGIDTEFVIATTNDVSFWPFANADGVRAQLSMYKQRGYMTMFDEQGWIVLRRRDVR